MLKSEGILLKGISGKKYIFEGLYKKRTAFENNPGVYAVVSKKENKINLLELSNSDKINDSIAKTEKKLSMTNELVNGYSYAAFYTVNDDILSGEEILKDIKEFYKLL